MTIDNLFEVISNMLPFLTINTAHLFQDYENDCNDYYSECGDFDLGMIEAGAVVSNFCRYLQFLKIHILFIGILSLKLVVLHTSGSRNGAKSLSSQKVPPKRYFG